MEPPNHAFDRCVDLYDSRGKKMGKSSEATYLPEHLTSSRSLIQRTHKSSSGHEVRRHVKNPSISSVLLAEGLELPTEEEELEELPPRYEPGSSKARLTWFGAICLEGIGMFVEAYIIITTGQIKTIWHSAYPLCFYPTHEMICPNQIHCCGSFPNTPDTCGLNDPDYATDGMLHQNCNPDGTYNSNLMCNESTIGGISYAEFAGIMIGMVTFGKVADLLGKHPAGMLTAVFQVIGVAMMTFYSSENRNVMFVVFEIFFFVFGFGVGGEYPLTAANAAAHHVESLEEASLDDAERHHIRFLRERERTARRGETIAMVFAMQGVGAVVGSIFLVCLIYFGEQGRVDCDIEGYNPHGQSTEALSAIWRTFYFIGLIFVLMVLIYRGLVLEEGDGHKKLLARKERRRVKLGRENSTFQVLWFYAPRLVGTGGCWFLVDVAFYGLKLFSGPIFAQSKSVNPDGDLITQNGYLLVNNLCALAGYYCAAYVIDKPRIGRKKLQMYSNIACMIIFLVAGGIFNSASPSVLMFLFFLSSFTVNFGPNVTTYVMAAETYPTELRATLHGMSAFLGKCGALMATICFRYLTAPQIFFVCAATSFIGSLFSMLFSVDLTGVSLAEHDAQLELFLEGNVSEYKGKLNDPKHLSLFERMTGRHGSYDPDWAHAFLRKMSQAVSHKYSD